MARNYTFSADQIQDPQTWSSTIVETSTVVYLRREEPDADVAIPLAQMVHQLGDPEQRAAISLLGVTYDHLSVDVSISHEDYLRVAFNRFVDQPTYPAHNTATEDGLKRSEQSKNLVTYLMHWARELILEEYRSGHPPVFLDEDRMNAVVEERRVREQMEYASRQQEAQNRLHSQYKQYMGASSLADLMYREQETTNNAMRPLTKTATQILSEQQNALQAQRRIIYDQLGAERVSPKVNEFTDMIKSMPWKKT